VGETACHLYPASRIALGRRRCNTETYTPRGATVLLDAIFTDGLENASQKYPRQDIAGMIPKWKKKNGWEFLFLAAGQDAIASAAQMSIHVHYVATVDSENRFRVRDSSRAMDRKIRAMRMADAMRRTSARRWRRFCGRRRGGAESLVIVDLGAVGPSKRGLPLENISSWHRIE